MATINSIMRRRFVAGGSEQCPVSTRLAQSPVSLKQSALIHRPSSEDSSDDGLYYLQRHCSPFRQPSSLRSLSPSLFLSSSFTTAAGHRPSTSSRAVSLYLSTAFCTLLLLFSLVANQPSFFVSHYKHNHRNDRRASSSFHSSNSEIRNALEASQGTLVHGNYIVFVSTSNGNQTSIFMGRSPISTYDAFQNAVSLRDEKQDTQKRQRPERGDKTTKSRDYYSWLKIDVVTSVESMVDFDLSRPFHAQVGGGRRFFYGLALDWQTGWAFLPEEVWANNMVDGQTDLIRWDNIVAHVVQKQQLQEKNVQGWAPLFGSSSSSLDTTTQQYDRNVEESLLSHGLNVFYTTSYFVDLSSSSASLPHSTALVPIYHGHRLFEKQDISPSLLMQASRAAGDYLIRSIKAAGKMVYIYNPRTDQEPDSYNLTRHAGTLYAMACLYHHTKDPELLASMRLSANWLLREHLEKCRLPYATIRDGRITTRRCIVEEIFDERIEQSSATTKVAKLGVNALTLLAISEFVAATHDHQNSNNELSDENDYFMEVAYDLADYIQSAQHTDGSFVQKIQYYPTFELDENFFVRYYQGEATFALSRFYYVAGWLGLEQKQDWLHVAEAAARYIIETNWEVPDDDFVDDHWLMYGLAEMNRCDPRRVGPRFVDFAMRTVRLVASSQYKEGRLGERRRLEERNLDLNDWVGIHHESTSATSTATKSEGLCAIYEIAEDHQRWGEVELIMDTITDSVRYQLKAQYGPELAMYMRDPARVLGGERKGIDSLLMRNDYTQHNLSSFLCLLTRMQQRNGGRKMD